jgi:hypothetical protein
VAALGQTAAVTFVVTHVQGNDGRDPSPGWAERLLRELDEQADDDHPDVSVSVEGGWSLSVFRRGVMWENVEDDDQSPFHIDELPRAEVVQLLETLARGDVVGVAAREWQPGYL